MRQIEMKAFAAMAVGDYMRCYNLFTVLITDKGAVESLPYYLGRARCALHMKAMTLTLTVILTSNAYAHPNPDPRPSAMRAANAGNDPNPKP